MPVLCVVRPVVLTVAAALAFVACTGDDDDAAVEDPVAAEPVSGTTSGATASLTLSDGRSWRFDSVLCQVGPDETGRPDVELVVTATADGLQLFASIAAFGHTVSINDAADPDAPSLSLSASAASTAQLGIDTEPIRVEDRRITASTSFDDDTTDEVEAIDGDFEADCA